ncbi:hypothetical protein ASG92_08375 [Arthrobacter sp. Soil736]|nr:hypothetical protein ASG92_08375 [Arthrobacter sp. Soil736]
MPREAFAERVPDPERTDLAEAKMREKPAGALDPGHVPSGPVFFDRSVQEILKPPAGALSGHPGGREAAAPAPARQELQKGPPVPVRTVHGSNSRFAWWLVASMPTAVAHSLTPASSVRSGSP